MQPLAPHTIFVTRAGSNAHGTAREGSDVDLRGVCIAPLAMRISLFTRFEQYEGPLDPELGARLGSGLPEATKIECVVYDIAKFLSLCAAANPNALELLFVEREDWLLDTPAWQRVFAERRGFLTRKVRQTYLGYALGQLQKIQVHRGWLRHPPKHKPTRAEFGLPDSTTLAVDDRAGIERYRVAMKQWESFQRWSTERNPVRAELERRHGYDTKHAMHLVRLMRVGLELLRTGELLVRRPDAEELLGIRDGALQFSELVALAETLQAELRGVEAHPDLPEDVDHARVDALLVELVRRHAE